MNTKEFTRFVCGSCGGWLWTENIHLSKPNEQPKINKTLTCVECLREIYEKN